MKNVANNEFNGSNIWLGNKEEYRKLDYSDKKADMDKCDVIYYFSQGKTTGTMYQEIFTEPISNKLVLANRVGFRESEADDLATFNKVVNTIAKETEFLGSMDLPFSCDVKVATLKNEFGKDERFCYIDFSSEVDNIPTDDKLFSVLQECICVMNTIFPRFNSSKDNVSTTDMSLKTLLNTLMEDGGELVSDLTRVTTLSRSIDGLVVNKQYQ